MTAFMLRHSNGASVQEFIALVPPVVAKYEALGRNVSFVSMSDKLTVPDLTDNLHPNQVGGNKMADTWLNAVQALLAV